MAPLDEPVPEPRRKPQIQLTLHSNIEGGPPEDIDEMLAALSVTGKPPHDVLLRFYDESTQQTLMVNTLGARRNIGGGTDITPHAGIRFDWRTGGSHAVRRGLAYLGGRPYYSGDFEGQVSLGDFASMQAWVHNLAKHKRRS